MKEDDMVGTTLEEFVEQRWDGVFAAKSEEEFFQVVLGIVRDAVLYAASMYEDVNPSSDEERQHNAAGAGAMGAVLDFRHAIRQWTVLEENHVRRIPRWEARQHILVELDRMIAEAERRVSAYGGACNGCGRDLDAVGLSLADLQRIRHVLG